MEKVSHKFTRFILLFLLQFVSLENIRETRDINILLSHCETVIP